MAEPVAIRHRYLTAQTASKCTDESVEEDEFTSGDLCADKHTDQVRESERSPITEAPMARHDRMCASKWHDAALYRRDSTVVSLIKGGESQI